MDVTWPDSVDSTTRTREHLSNLYSLFVVSMMMFDGRTEDDILELARTSVPSVSSCRVVAAYLAGDGRLVRLDGPTPRLGVEVDLLDGSDGEVTVDGAPWARAFVLRDFSAAERKDLPFLVDRCADATEALVTQGLVAAQNLYHAEEPAP